MTFTNSALSAACLASFGAVPNTNPPAGGIDRTTSHGIVTFIVTGTWEMSGAVTLVSSPFCGQFSVAVVCTTGSSGVATDSTKPIRPAIVATQRAIRTSDATSRLRVAVMAVP